MELGDFIESNPGAGMGLLLCIAVCVLCIIVRICAAISSKKKPIKHENIITFHNLTGSDSVAGNDEAMEKIMSAIQEDDDLRDIVASVVGGNQFNNTNYKNIDTGDDGDFSEYVDGYYRYQKDNQVVIQRTKEQQRIFDEYFVIKNYKTIKCDSRLRRISKVLKIISHCLCWPGIILFVWGLIESEDGLKILGAFALVGAIVLRIVSGIVKRRYEDSIDISHAPKKVMTDEEYEKLVDEKIESMNIEQMGLEKLGLDPEQIQEIRPIVLRNKVINDYSLRVKNYKDNTIHSSTQHVTYLYFTDEQLFVYKIVFDMCCNMQDEWAKEFFYKDICDISTHTERNVLTDGKMKFEYSTVSFDIIVTNSEIGFVLDGDNENINSLMAMKQKIREKK